MATTYHYYKEGYAVPYDAFGMAVLRKRVNIPKMISDGALGISPLAVADVRTALPAIGFDTGDILEVFRVPAGFHAVGGGVNVVTIGDGTASTIDVGVQSTTQTQGGQDIDYWLDAGPLSAANVLVFDHADGDAFNVYYEDVYITDGSIDIVFNASDDEGAAIFDIWVRGCKAF
jgi:hypothetical protein